MRHSHGVGHSGVCHTVSGGADRVCAVCTTLMVWWDFYVYLGMKKQRGEKAFQMWKAGNEITFYERIYKICYQWWIYSKLICGINEV